MPQLVVVTGPIASGKSTLTSALAHRLRDDGLSVATADLDDLVAAQDGFRRSGDVEGTWQRARDTHGRLVGAWLRTGIDLVLVDGPFYTPEEVTPLLADLPADVAPRWVLLYVQFDDALARATSDMTRGMSRNPDFLRATHDRFNELVGVLPTAEWTFDTSATPTTEIVAVLAPALMGSADA